MMAPVVQSFICASFNVSASPLSLNSETSLRFFFSQSDSEEDEPTKKKTVLQVSFVT